MPVLAVSDLCVNFGEVPVLRGVSFTLEKGKTLGVVGESGCGKSMTAFSIMGMVPSPGKITGGSISLDGLELVGLKESKYRELRGKRIALVMQDPFTSLNPMMRVGEQIAEVLIIHQGQSKREANLKAIELLKSVGVPGPADSARKYPHEMSGGQRQRVVIAMAFACQPEALIADEPTTALDVTLQAQILRLLKDLQEVHGTAIMIVSHDIQAIGAVSHNLAVFYAGKVVEYGSAESVLRNPKMPYTQALLKSLPRPGQTQLEAISGLPPKFGDLGPGCPFAPRCTYRFDQCSEEPSLLEVGEGHRAACWLPQKSEATASC